MAAAARNAVIIRRLDSRVTAAKSSSLVGKSRNTYAWEIPASFAISVVAAAGPCSAKTRIAASTSSSRRCSAVERVRVGVSAVAT